MDPATKDRILKPSADKFAEIIRSHPTVGWAAGIQPQKITSSFPCDIERCRRNQACAFTGGPKLSPEDEKS
jgi:hypothetical protein